MNSAQWQNVLESLTLFISASAVLVQNLRNAIEANMQQGGEGGGAGAAGGALAEMPPCAAFIEEESEEENGLCYCPSKKKKKDTACPCPSNERYKKGSLPVSRTGSGQQPAPGEPGKDSKSKVGKSVSYIDQQQDGGAVAPEEAGTPQPPAQVEGEAADGTQNQGISIVAEGEPQAIDGEPGEVKAGDQETPSAVAVAEKEEPSLQKIPDPEGDGEDSNDEAQRPPQPSKGRICPLAKKKKPKGKIAATASQPNLEEISALRVNLQSAQKSLSDVEERLRRMERNMQDFETKNTASGQPNPAALYREIMKPQSVPFLSPPLAQSSAIGLQQQAVCPPSCQASPNSGSNSGGGWNLGQSKTLDSPPVFHELGSPDSSCPGSPSMGCGQMQNVSFGTPRDQGIRGVVSPYRPTPSQSSQWNGSLGMMDNSGRMQNITPQDQGIRGVVSPYRPTPSPSPQWNGLPGMMDNSGQIQNITPQDQGIRGVVNPYRPTPSPSPQWNGALGMMDRSGPMQNSSFATPPDQGIRGVVSPYRPSPQEHDVSSSGHCRSGCPPGTCAMPPTRPGDPGRGPKKINYLRTAPFPGSQMRLN